MRMRQLVVYLISSGILFRQLQHVNAGGGKIDLYLQNTELDQDSNRARNNLAYYGVYYIGTPPRRFLGCFDSGSGDTWVPSNTCSSTICRSHDQYDPTLSSSERNSSRLPVTIQYGTGTVAAILVFETVSIAGINITDQGIGVATALTFDFAQTSCDGLVGLGFQPLSSIGALPPFLNAVREGVLDQNLFSLWLSPDPGVEPAGELTFGTIDSSRYTGQIQYVDVSQELYWQVDLDSITVDGNNVGVSANTAIVDSATTAILMSTSDAASVHQQIPGAQFWQERLSWNVSCQILQLPDVTFNLGGKPFSVPPQLYVQLLTDRNGSSLGTCSSAIVGGGSSISSGPVIVLGTNFLRAWYTVHVVKSENGAAQMGFAPSKGQSSTPVGGRRLRHEGGSLFSRTADSLLQPRWSNSARRKLSETSVGASSEQPEVFRRTVESAGHYRWGKGVSQQQGSGN